MWTRTLAFLLLLLVPPPALAGGLPQGDPQALGFSAQGLETIDAAMRRMVDEKQLAGLTIAIARDGKLAYVHSAGMADIARGRPMTADTLVRVYSMTKPITAVAVMMLVEEGRLRLSDRLSDYLPEFADARVIVGDGPDTEPAKQPIRIWHLLTHTSGLTYALYDNPAAKIYEKHDVMSPERTLEQFGKLVASLPLASQPGSQYNYGVSIDILGRVVEVVSGEPFDKFVRDRITGPLGMKDTAFAVPAGQEARLAELYGPGPDGAPAPLVNQVWHPDYVKGSPLKSGGGGLLSTANDYLRFCQMLLNGGELDGVRLLSPKTVQLMTTGQLPSEKRGRMAGGLPGYDMGLVFAVLDDVGASELPGSVGEFNWAGAASTHFFIDPKEKIVAVLMTQMYPDKYQLRRALKTLVYQALVRPRDAGPSR